MYKALHDINWDFKSHDTQYMTHGIHKYPARMIPQIADTLIRNFSNEGDLVVDPFTGSGTVITEAILNNRKALGNDLNPLAILLSKVRNTPISKVKLDRTLNKLMGMSFNNNYSTKKTREFFDNIKEETNLCYWFNNEVIEGLINVKSMLDSLDLDTIEKDFFKVCFSYTVRQVSYLRQGEYKIYRIPEAKLAKHNPDVIKQFLTTTQKFITKMTEYTNFLNEKGYKPDFKITQSNSKSLPKRIYKDNSIDLIVTSPPYGDSRTTVAYGQFSRYSLIWLGFEKKETYDIDKILLGGQKTDFINEVISKTLEEKLIQINERDIKRGDDTLWFVHDLYLTIKEMGRILKRDGHACIVIGNRAVRRIRIPMSQIIAEMAENAPDGYKFEHITTIGRNIPNKNNPITSKFKLENGEFEWIKTMSTEDIIILKKL